MARVELSQQVHDYVRRLAPESRRALKRAFRELQEERGDIRSLEYALAGYHRLRVGKFRAVFRYGEADRIDVVFIEERSIVYEVFEAQFLAKLRRLGE